MRPTLYLMSSLVAFLLGTVASDLVARTSIAGEALGQALSEHWHYAAAEPVGSLILLAPFLGVGLVSATVEKWARTRSAILLFTLGTAPLLYSYFTGYQAAQHALLDEKWTAAALSVGLLPFIVGIPVLFVLALAGVLAVGIHRRPAT
jgi:hypothetical protein